MKTNPKKRAFSEGVDKEIQAVAHATWQAIGGEILECSGQDSMSSKDVVDTVMDAGYMEKHGIRGYMKVSDETKRIIHDMYSSQKMIEAVQREVKKAFSKFKRYGY